MGTLSLFPDKLTGKPITPNGEWGYYFNGKDIDQLAQELNKYKKAGYIEFDKEIVKLMHLNPKGGPKFSQTPISFSITEVHVDKIRADLKEYLENWVSNRLLTNTAHKPDDCAHHHEKLLAAIRRVYERQSMPHITMADVYGNSTDYVPFWETVLAPQLVSNQYEIRQMDYDLIKDGQLFVDIAITDTKLRLLLEQSRNPPAKQIHKARIFISDERIVYVELDGSENHRVSRKLRTDSTTHNFINYMLSHPRTRISHADIKIATGSKDITELVRGCGFDRHLKEIFFPSTTEKTVLFDPSPVITPKQTEYIKKYNWDKVGKT